MYPPCTSPPLSCPSQPSAISLLISSNSTNAPPSSFLQMPSYQTAREMLNSERNEIAPPLCQHHPQGSSPGCLHTMNTIFITIPPPRARATGGGSMKRNLASEIPMTLFDIACDSSTYNYVEYTPDVLVSRITPSLCFH